MSNVDTYKYLVAKKKEKKEILVIYHSVSQIKKKASLKHPLNTHLALLMLMWCIK